MLVIVGVVVMYLLWGKADAAGTTASITTYGDIQALRDAETLWRYAAYTVAAATAFLAFTWYGRKGNQ